MAREISEVTEGNANESDAAPDDDAEDDLDDDGNDWPHRPLPPTPGAAARAHDGSLEDLSEELLQPSESSSKGSSDASDLVCERSPGRGQRALRSPSDGFSTGRVHVLFAGPIAGGLARWTIVGTAAVMERACVRV